MAYIDTNRPNLAQSTSIDEWLASLSLTQYVAIFKRNGFLNLSQIVDLQMNDLVSLGIWDQLNQSKIIESLKTVQFEIAFRNGFLV